MSAVLDRARAVAAGQTLRLHGVHHTARPTWKLKETVDFYRDGLGLPLIHSIAPKGWGPAGHPDFLHFFFDAGNHSTIAFFYYIGTSRPEQLAPFDSWFYRATHTAWRVESQEELLHWKQVLESRGIAVRQTGHELIDSIYMTDPNGYMVEITWEMRPMGRADALDAELTIEAAVQLETEARSKGAEIPDIEAIWRRKGQLLSQMLKKEGR